MANKRVEDPAAAASAQQLHQRAEELKDRVGKRRKTNVLLDGEAWTALQELQVSGLCRHL